MSIFAPLQYKSARTTSPVRQRTAVFQSSGGIEPQKTPSISDPERSPDQQHSLHYSLANIPIDSPDQTPHNRLEEHRENHTGLPDKLKAGIESLSGMSLDDVHVHYNSSKPAQVQALAYTQGAQIHVGPGQEKHIPHEAWHVVQQKQERVKPTMQIKSNAINDNDRLEHEADVMGLKADTLQTQAGNLENSQHQSGCGCASCAPGANATIQKKLNPGINGSLALGLRGHTNVIQRVKGCQVCGHKHGSAKCTVMVNGKECGCESHSSKWDSGSKFNPGAGKRERMLEAMKGKK